MFVFYFISYLIFIINLIFIGVISYNIYKFRILYKENAINELKENIVKNVVMGVEQLYGNLSS